jgi:hypothetical protein
MCEGMKRSDRSAELALAFISPSEIRGNGRAPSSGFNAHATETIRVAARVARAARLG